MFYFLSDDKETFLIRDTAVIKRGKNCKRVFVQQKKHVTVYNDGDN